jgi:hypothetical protein
MLSVIVDGIEYPLDDGSLCWWQEDDGVGMLPQHLIESRGAQQHGATYRDFRADPRDFRLYLELDQASREALYTARQTLLGIFAPGRALSVRYTFPSGALRQIDCRYRSDMSLPTADQQGFTQKVVVGLRAFDPTFYDPAGVTSSFNLGGGSGGTVPTEIPMFVGSSVLNQTNTVTYAGDWRDYPLIRLTGPVTDCILTNLTTGDILDFTGVTIAAGDFYEIDCRYGYKTVVDAAGVNKIADLSTTSDLSTFHLASALETPDGINAIKVTGSAATESTRIDVTFYERYLGV